MAEDYDRLTAALGDSYGIERQIGAGGMATVYLAHDVRHDRKVALKVLRPELAAVLGVLKRMRRWFLSWTFPRNMQTAAAVKWTGTIPNARPSGWVVANPCRRSARPYLPPMRDTTAAAEQTRIDAIRRVEPAQRLAQALELSESVRAIALSRLRELHPDRTELELVELLTGNPLIPTHSAGPPA